MCLFQMYRIYVNHHFGNSAVRYLLLTTYAAYVLESQSSMDTRNGEESSKSSDGVSKYATEVVVPYSVIDYISVSGIFLDEEEAMGLSDGFGICVCLRLM